MRDLGLSTCLPESRMSTTQTVRRITFAQQIVTHIQLLDPVTWLGPWQAFCCGVLAAGVRSADVTPVNFLKFVLACGLIGPLLTGFSQSINDYFDRHLDAINDPERPIPSGRISLPAARANFIITALLAVGNTAALYMLTKSPFSIALGLGGLFLAYVYSAPGFRFKENGWLGTTSVGVGYCIVPWLFSAELFLKPGEISYVHLILGVINGLVAMGLIAMNDFKAIEGDRQNGLKTLPVMYGVRGAMVIAFFEINLAQIIFVGLCFYLNQTIIGILGAVLFLPQVWQQVVLYRNPENSQVLDKIGKNSAGRALVSQSQTGAHPGFLKFLVISNLLTVTELTALSVAHGYFR